MNINPYEFEKAKDGSIFVKRGDKLVAVSFKEISKDLETKCDGVVNWKQMTKENNQNIVNIQDYIKSLKLAHFISVFSLFELKALKGELEVSDEEILNLDEKVLNGEVSVEQAINEFHPYLKTTFEKLYGKVGN